MYLQSRSPIQIIARPKLIGIGEHWGVRLPDGRVADLSADRGLRVMSMEQFAAGRPTKIVRHIPDRLAPEVMHRLQLAFTERRAYDAIGWNCEHFANWLTAAKMESPQVSGVLLLALCIAAIRSL